MAHGHRRSEVFGGAVGIRGAVASVGDQIFSRVKGSPKLGAQAGMTPAVGKEPTNSLKGNL